jgi:glycosyltransferase involved in cell wall biosynthesis
MSTFSYLTSLYTLASRGHSVLCVSETSRQEWEAYIQKNRDYILRSKVLPVEGLEPGAVFTGYLHNPVVWERPSLKPTKRGFISLGRVIRQKRHHVGLAASQDLTLYCPTPFMGNKDSSTLLQKLEKKFGEERIMKGLPYSILMETLSESRALLSFSIESFGLTGMEANSFGVPVILQHPVKKHALEEACHPSIGHGSLVRVENESDLASFLRDFKPYSDRQRQAILDCTWEYYGVSAALKRLEESLHFAVEGATQYEDDASEDTLTLWGNG